MKGHVEPDRAGRKNVWLICIEGETNAAGKRKRHYHQYRGGRREAEKELVRRLAELHSGTYVAPNSLTVGAWLNQWLAGPATMRCSATTLQTYRTWIDRRIIPAIGNQKLDALTAAQIQAAWAAMLTGGRLDRREGAGVSAVTVRRCHEVLRAALQTAVRHGVIARNPCDLVELPKARRVEACVLTAEEIGRLIEAARGTRLHLPILLSATVGLRRGEVLALRWQDVNLEAKTLTVARATEQTKAHGVRMKEPKSGKPRRIHMPQLLVDELRRHREEQGRVAGLVVCDPFGQPYSPSAISSAFWAFVRTVEGVPVVRYHDLRHSAATLLLSLGIPLPVVSEILGHARTSTTANIYAHVLQSSRVEAADTMDAALRKAQGG